MRTYKQTEMARTIEEGLEYFPLDVDFFDDPKILLVEEQYGLKAGYVASRLLCWIYRNGYYTPWNDDMALVFAKRVGNGITHAFVNDVVNALVKRSFFDKALFERCAILTSAGIQKRWLRIILDAKRKARIDPTYNLLKINSGFPSQTSEVSTPEQELITGETEGITQRKGKYSIGKKRMKESDDSKPPEGITPDLKTGKGEEDPPPVAAAPPFFLPTFVDIDLLKEKVFADRDSFVRIYVGWGLSQERIYEWLVAFNSWLRYQGEVKKLEKDYRKHFGN